MTPPPAFETLPELLSPEVSRAYARFLAETASDDAYLFTDPRVRFHPENDDVLVAAPGLTAEPSARGTRLHAPSLAEAVDVAAPHAAVARFLAALDGEATLARTSERAGLEPNAAVALVRGAFGLVLFAPLAVMELERRVPAAEIVRFPGSPYEIPRRYWSNMAAVRERVPRLLERLGAPLEALEELRRLHAVALVGEDGRSFYRPASPIAKKGIEPGALWLAETRTLETPEGTRLVEGPRVNAQFLGGARYGELVAELSGDPGAARERLEHRDAAGLAWGKIVFGRAEGDPRDEAWFCPPRALLQGHVESAFTSLSGALAAARSGRRQDLHAELASFHQKLARLHLFRAANQSLAMAVVNAVLAGAGGGPAGSGVPHLVLDQLALRLSEPAYRNVFALALEAWTVEGPPAERLRRYADNKRRWYALIERLGAARDADEARSFAEASPPDARLALLAVAQS